MWHSTLLYGTAHPFRAARPTLSGMLLLDERKSTFRSTTNFKKLVRRLKAHYEGQGASLRLPRFDPPRGLTL